MDTPAGAAGYSEAFRLPPRLDAQPHTTTTVLAAVADLALKSTPPAAAVSITVLTGDRASTPVSTSQVALDLDEAQYAQGYGPCVDAVLAGDIMEMVDARTETRWPEFATAAVDAGAFSVLSVPIPMTPALAAGVNVYAAEANAFSTDDRDRLTGLVEFAGAAIANLQLVEESKVLVLQLQIAMQSRAVIDQARGILMAQHGCDAEEAFAILRRTSQQANIKIRDLAQQTVAAAAKG